MKHIYYALRVLPREMGANVTKVISLSLGLIVGILLFSQIAFELSYERCYPDAERLVLVGCRTTNLSTGEVVRHGDSGMDYTVFAPVAAALAQDLPELVEHASCVCAIQERNVYYEDRLLKDAGYIFADTCFFRTMGIPVLKGNEKDLIMPGSVFVSERFAREVFGNADPVGKTLSMGRKIELTVRGVYKDVPENTILTHDFVVSVHRDGGYMYGNGWKGNDVFNAFLRLRSASDIDRLNARIQSAIERYTPGQYAGWKMDFSVTPIVKLHLEDASVRKRLFIYGFLGFSIFFTAIMNYILISVSALGRRAKSVGVYKCSGAGSADIFGMFLAETGVLVLVSVLLSFLCIYNARTLIEDLLSVKLSSLFAWETMWVPALVVVTLFVLAGCVPGHLFSRIPVTQVFRRHTDGKKGWKRSLLFVQFMGASFVMGLLLVAISQYRHLMSRDMGIDVPGLVEAGNNIPEEMAENVKEALARQPMAEGVTVSTHSVLGQYWTQGLMSNDGRRLATLNLNYCRFNYPEVMGIGIVEGTSFRKEEDILVNEELVRLMRWTDGAVGKKLNGLNGTITGVFRDIRNESFYGGQSPIALIAGEKASLVFNVRLKEPYDENLRRLNRYMEETYPLAGLNFMSVDSMLKDIYKPVYRFRNSVWITSGFILLIIVMGLIGYVSDETRRRSKEIAVRKVNGAEVGDVLRLLVRDILYVSVFAVLIGTVASYVVGKAWLSQFAEHIRLHPLLFAGTALFILLLAVVCVVLKAWRIARENPVNSIKAE